MINTGEMKLKMPIDDQLNGIEIDESKDKVNVPNQTNKSTLISDANKILSNFLVNNFFEQQTKIYNNIRIFLESFGPYLLNIAPVRNQYDNTIRQKVALEPEIPGDIWNYLIDSISNSYLLSTDLKCSDDAKLTKAEYSKRLPEIIVIDQLVCDITRELNGNPLILPMGMDISNRSLVAIAIDRAMSNSDISSYNPRSSPNSMHIIVPNLKYISEVAKDYKISELTPVLADLQKILNRYLSKL